MRAMSVSGNDRDCLNGRHWVHSGRSEGSFGCPFPTQGGHRAIYLGKGAPIRTYAARLASLQKAPKFQLASSQVERDRSAMTTPHPLCIAFVVFGDVVALDLVGPLEAFTVARTAPLLATGEPYRTRIVSETGGLLVTRSGLAINTEPISALDDLAIDTLVVIGGGGRELPVVPEILGRWLCSQAEKVRRLCSVCTGSLILAAMGLADGKKITTHWAWLDRMAKAHPRACVERGPIYVRDGKLCTSAGVTAGIDLALALIEDDFGRVVAMQVARRLVVYLNRPGNQEQFSSAFKAQARADGQFFELIAWMSDNLDEDLSVEALAGKVSMSPRTFARKFAAQLGQTPAKFVSQLRTEAARRALEEGRLPMNAIAKLVGLGDEQGLRRTMLRSSAITPTEYRERFGPS